LISRGRDRIHRAPKDAGSMFLGGFMGCFPERARLREPSRRGILRALIALAKGERMPKLEVEGVGAFDVEEGKRLVLGQITLPPVWV
jgi:hypothetical protein